MIFLNSVIISNKIQDNDSLLKAKSFAASVALHATLMEATLYFVSQHPILLPKEEPIMISLADFTPTSTVSLSPSISKIKHTAPLLKSVNPISKTPVKTPQKISSPTPMIFSEASTPQNSPVHPSVAPSDFNPLTYDLLHSNQSSATNDSPHYVSIASQTTEITKPNISSEEINGATLGRIRAMIENSLTYPAIARKLRLEGTVTVSFLLKPSGLVEKAEILSSSGSTLLDTKAIQTVLALSGEYPTLPKAVYLKIPIAFSLKKS